MSSCISTNINETNEMHSTMKLHIIYGSQTGNAEDLAYEAERQGNQIGFDCSAFTADGCNLQSYCYNSQQCLFFVSTTGQGEFPDNFRKLWRCLLNAALPSTHLTGLNFSIFGLGDSRYKEFNYAARKLRRRLLQLGGNEVYSMGLGNDEDELGYEAEFDSWLAGYWHSISTSYNIHRTVNGVEIQPTTPPPPLYDVQIVGAGGGGPESPRPTPPGSSCTRPSMKRLFPYCEKSNVDGSHVRSAKILFNKRITSDTHFQDVRLIRLEIPPNHTALSYSSGDVCCIYPRISCDVVEELLERLQLDGKTLVKISNKQHMETAVFPSYPITLWEVFSYFFDLHRIPHRSFFKYLSFFTNDALHADKLKYFTHATRDSKEEYYSYCKEAKRSYIEVLNDFYSSYPPLEHLFSMLPIMKPRKFSIASADKWFYSLPHWLPSDEMCAFVLERCSYNSWLLLDKPFNIQFVEKYKHYRRMLSIKEKLDAASCCATHVDICAALVDYGVKFRRRIKGCCSKYFEQLEGGDSIPVYIERGYSFTHHPSLYDGLIMVCPGTGVAPCRALIQERHLQFLQSNGERNEKDLLVLGFRSEGADYLFKNEWEIYSKWLDVIVAFSRDDEEKVYVQHKLKEYQEKVYHILNKQNSFVYVCGRSHPMPVEVENTFVEVLVNLGNYTEREAMMYIATKKRNGRYVCDTWG